MTNEALVLSGRAHDLGGGLVVRRLLPDARRRAVGPFVFFDHFGPVTLAAEADSDVGPHPHIGLATVTYLFEGAFWHRDSLGTSQVITPGAINWMTAGRGIVHSERAPPETRGQPRRLHGLQVWVALPPVLETCAPDFQHLSAAEVPQVRTPEGAEVRVLVGQAYGLRSPVRAASPTLYLDVSLGPGLTFELPPLAEELAVYGPLDAARVDGEDLPERRLRVLPAGQGARLQAGATGWRGVVIGGAALPEPVHLWWNFVSSRRERLAEAAQRWADGGFTPVPGETGGLLAPPWRD